MSYHGHHHTHHVKSYAEIVWACAWCNPRTYTPLKHGQEYTHGICKFHKQEFIKKSARLFIKRKLN